MSVLSRRFLVWGLAFCIVSLMYVMVKDAQSKRVIIDPNLLKENQYRDMDKATREQHRRDFQQRKFDALFPKSNK